MALGGRPWTFCATLWPSKPGYATTWMARRWSHGFVAAHLSLVDQFLLHSEYELNKGYADLYLEPFLAQYPDVGFGYVLELKYVKRSESARRIRCGGQGAGGRASGTWLFGRYVVAPPLPVGAAYRLGGGVSRLGDGCVSSRRRRRGGTLICGLRNRRLRSEVPVQPVLGTLLRRLFRLLCRYSASRRRHTTNETGTLAAFMAIVSLP